ncbi:porin family protein [Flavivirga spongiicola]|uniref:PorT family protein n=1 Tax=Flavivirga spongiicola TaxID=421621 RepID=A0ABU7XNR6_9FLAO|nr:porin family protein [Flavivirga sp. MEBiC05379]MDO5981752.1 porin family protein [Flavivirga sp. MEBiC05379]
MTKIILQLIFLLSFFNIVAQNSKIEIGPEIGLNISDYRYIEAKYVKGSAMKRASFGVVGKYNFSRNWALKSKLKYEGKGILIKVDFGRGLLTQKLNYLVMPLMAEWRLGKGNLQGFLNFGMYGGRLMSATKEYFNEHTMGEKDIKNNKDEFKPYDSGLSGGIGAIYKLKNNLKITIDLGGQFGMTPIDSGLKRGIGWRANQNLNGNIGVLFGL